jgi:tetratricopeptide (TPR) repeat protein
MDALRHFQTGMDLFGRGLGKEAMGQLARAYAWEPSNATYQSYYGLALAVVAGDYAAGLELISAAIEKDSENPAHHLNLARAHLRHRQEDNAVTQLYEALHLDPENQDVIHRLQDLRVRARPALRSLGRAHWLNRLIGRLRHALCGFSNLREMDP